MEYIKPTEQFELEVEFIERILLDNSVKAGLDLGCGAGKHFQRLRGKVQNLYAVDLNDLSDLNNYYRLNFFDEQLPVADLDFVYCLSPNFGDSWWRLEELFLNINSSLKNGGKFLLDLFELNSYDIGESWIKRKSINGKLITSQYTRYNDRVVCEKIVTIKTDIIGRSSRIWRVLSLDEIKELASKTGFSVFATFSNFTDQPSDLKPNLRKTRNYVLFVKL